MLALLSGGCGETSRDVDSAQANAGPEFVGSRVCADCHRAEFDLWQGSHHDLAMQAATADTVLGDFADAQFSYFGRPSRFFVRDGRYWVRTDNAAGEMQEFEIRYTFGVTPLQQYLVEFPGGRLQALSIAWDTRSAEEGGQRWFHLYGDEFIAHDDALHWTGREQNWNYMCAECHSTNLQKNYDLQSDTFSTTWSEINVGCEACHGPASLHVASAAAGTLERDGGLQADLNDSGNALWRMNPETGIAARSEIRMSPPEQPEACGRCHARRSLATTEYRFGQPLADTHMPALLHEGLYYPDGQILEEVYVYGSFLQSRMYGAGVTCSDCHEPHAATLRTTDNVNDVCNGCHLPTKFATVGHHRHQPGSTACVDCHMVARDYMVVDGRRDHSFRVPRPDLSVETGSPNACNNCHREQTAAWADAAIRQWFGEQRPDHYASAIHAGRSGQVDANEKLLATIGNATFPGIVRGTGLTLLEQPFSREAMAMVQRQLSNGDPFLRIGALRAMTGLPAELRAEWAAFLLSDPLTAVRIEAVGALSDARELLPPPQRANFRRAEKDYIDAQLAIAERPEALGNLGNLFRDAAEPERAEQFYRLALQKEPRAVAARVNLADLYRRQQRDADAEGLLRAGLVLDESQAALHHVLGLLLVRSQQQQAALSELERAETLDPDSSRYAFVYAIALNSLGQGEAAIDALTDAQSRFPADFDINWSLVTMLRDQGRIEEARAQAEILVARFPGDDNARVLQRSLSGQ